MENYENGQHPDTAELLSISAGDASAELARHVQGCAACLVALDEMQHTRDTLSHLPLQEPPEHVWSVIESRLDAGQPAVGVFQRHMVRNLSIAASFLIAVLSLLFIPHAPQQGSTEIMSLASESRGLESALAYLVDDSQAMDLDTAGRIASYEDRIAALDVAISEHPEQIEIRKSMMQERVRLLRGLVEARSETMMAALRTY